jgi:lipopolysaccharide export system protein LptA
MSGLNKYDRAEIEKKAKSEGYEWNTDGDKMINGKGDFMKFSETKKSVDLNGQHFNDSHNANKSKGW